MVRPPSISRNRFSTEMTLPVIEVPIVPTFEYRRTGRRRKATYSKNMGKSVIEVPISVIESPMPWGILRGPPKLWGRFLFPFLYFP